MNGGKKIVNGKIISSPKECPFRDSTNYYNKRANVYFCNNGRFSYCRRSKFPVDCPLEDAE